VVSWRVLAGPAPGSLTARATMPDSGFESSATFPDEGSTTTADADEYVAVQALGPSGALLGTSPVVKVAGR